MGRLCALLVVALPLLLLCVDVATSDVCLACECRRNGFHYDVSCKCDGENTDLDFTAELMTLKDDPRLASPESRYTPLTFALSVADCRAVTFRENLLLMATKVAVRNVTKLRLEEDAFVVVGDLEIRHVDAVALAAGALFTHNVTSLVVEDSLVEAVEAFALASLPGLRRLELRRVTVEALHSHAVVLAMAELSQVFVCDTVIIQIKTDGLIVKADNLTVLNSSFGVVEDGGVQLGSPSSTVRLDNNTFENLRGPRSLCVDGADVRVTDNAFSSVPGCVLAKGLQKDDKGGGRPRLLDFAGNRFRVRISDVPTVDLDALANVTEKHYRNSFRCECTDDFGRSLASMQDAGYGPLLEATFCDSERCPLSISHGQLLGQYRGNWTRCALEEECVPALSSDSCVAFLPLLALTSLWTLLTFW